MLELAVVVLAVVALAGLLVALVLNRVGERRLPTRVCNAPETCGYRQSEAFTCPGCQRECCPCSGCADDYPDLCDDCWFRQERLEPPAEVKAAFRGYPHG